MVVLMTSSSDGRDIYVRRRYGDFLRLVVSRCVPIIAPAPVGDFEKTAREYARLADGILLTGGGDMAGESSVNVDEARDLFELSLIRAAEERKRPVLGICRGMQVMNVARGGSLWSDVGRFTEECHASCRHHVKLSGVFADICGSGDAVVNSYHHQAVWEIGHGLEIGAVTDAGVNEAIFDPSLPFFAGVQWHPEMDKDAFAVKLFEKFLSYCG